MKVHELEYREVDWRSIEIGPISVAGVDMITTPSGIYTRLMLLDSRSLDCIRSAFTAREDEIAALRKEAASMRRERNAALDKVAETLTAWNHERWSRMEPVEREGKPLLDLCPMIWTLVFDEVCEEDIRSGDGPLAEGSPNVIASRVVKEFARTAMGVTSESDLEEIVRLAALNRRKPA